MKNELYVIYCESTDIDKLVTSDIKEALLECGELIDDGVDSAYAVLIYNNMTVDEYYDDHRIVSFNYHYSCAEFIAKNSPFHVPETDPASEVLNKEIYHNLDEAEQIEVLHFIPDDILIDEVMRRMHEYRKATDNAYAALESMLIYK